MHRVGNIVVARHCVVDANLGIVVARRRPSGDEEGQRDQHTAKEDFLQGSPYAQHPEKWIEQQQ